MGKDSKKLNFKCIYCGNIYGSIKGVCAHVRQKHKKKYDSLCYEVTHQKALPLAYGRSRSKTALIKEYRHDKRWPNFRCVHCNRIFKSRVAVAVHMKLGHKKTMTTKDYRRTAKPVTAKKK